MLKNRLSIHFGLVLMLITCGVLLILKYSNFETPFLWILEAGLMFGWINCLSADDISSFIVIAS